MATARPDTTRIWKALGGRVSFVRSVNWTRVFNLGFAAGYSLERLGMTRWRPVARPLLAAAQAVTDRLPAISLRVPHPATRDEELSARAMLEHLPTISAQLRVYPDYDEKFLSWLFYELREVRSRGDLVKRLVYDSSGRVLGWYIMYLQPGGISHVLQIGAKDRDVETVLDHLLSSAQRDGAAVVTGQLEPKLFDPVVRRRCLLQPVVNFLVHARNPEVLNAVLAEDKTMISELEGEWWMGYGVEPFS